MNYRLIAAAVILALYAVLGVVLLICSSQWKDPSGMQWTHALTVFSAFGAMATASASVLLGVEVQRANVAQAREGTQEAFTRLGALSEAHRIAIAAANGALAPASASATSAEDRLSQVRTLLADAPIPAPARTRP